MLCQSILKLPYNSLGILDLQMLMYVLHYKQLLRQLAAFLHAPCISGINLSGNAITPDMVCKASSTY